MWRIDGNSFVERETAAECERVQWGRRGSEIAKMFSERTLWMRVRLGVG